MRMSRPLMDRRARSNDPDAQRGARIPLEYKRIIGERCRDEREAKSLTQRELAAMLDIGETGISQLETGRSCVTPERYFQIAKIFELDMADFGKFILRHTDPWIFSMIFGTEDRVLRSDLKALSAATRINRRRGPHPH